MLITILLIVVPLIGMIVGIILNKKANWDNDLEEISFPLIVCFGAWLAVAVVVFSITLPIVQVPMAREVKEKLSLRIKNCELTYKILTESSNDNAVYTAIQQYNSEASATKAEIVTNQYWANNPWTSWLIPHTYNLFDADQIKLIGE